MNSNRETLRAAYERDGFVLVPQLLRADECDALKAESQRVLQENVDNAATVFVGAAAASPLFYQLAGDARIAEILRALMPRESNGIAFLSDKIVFKSGAQTFATPWHYDAAYWPNTRAKISVWIALDEVNASNGALKVLPASHTRDWVHQSGNGAGANNEFSSNIAPDWDSQDEIVCALPQGGAIFFSDRLLHASCENPARADRFSIISTYHASAPEEEFDAQFAARHVVA